MTVSRRVVLLRGINVGGHHKLPMAQLREVCESTGCTDVSTYIQSGNVILDSELDDARLVSGLEEAIEGAVGFVPRVVVRSADELEAALEHNPYPDANERYLHIGFLSAAPEAAALREVKEIDAAPERFQIIGTEIYLDYVDGAGHSKRLAKIPFERKLGVAITARNLRTVRKLVELSAR